MKEKLDSLAKRLGYLDRTEFMLDYGLMPSVRIPKHRKYEVIPLIIQEIIRQKQKK